MTSIGGCLLDLSGVLHVGNTPLPGAHEALTRLRRLPLGLRFLTNTSRTPHAVLLTQLNRMGLEIAADELLTAPLATRSALKQRGLRPYLLIHPHLRPDFAGLPRHRPNAVVVGDAGPYFSYQRLNRALRLLMDGAPLLAIAQNRYFMAADGLNLDAGAFVAGLEYAAGVQAEVIGKPAPAMFHTACAQLGLPPDQVVMVGDDVEADVLGALEAGLQAVLVRTGKFREADLYRLATRAPCHADIISFVRELETGMR
ncbi:MAG: TIGR01458 family HAD-type hydrolase [Pseudomonadota bacterium]